MIAAKIIFGTFLMVSCFLASGALAETMLEMTLEEQVKVADLAIEGRVLEAKSRWGDKEHTEVWTDYVLKVEDVLHGNFNGDTIVVTQQGGALEGVILRVGSNPELVKGDRVVLMLAKADFLRGMARGDERPKHTIVGIAQGTYYIVKGKQGDVAIRDFARLVIVPRPELPPAKRPRVEFLKTELEALERASRQNPDDRGLARLVAKSQALLEAAPKSAKRKPVTPTVQPSDGGIPDDLSDKPPPQSAPPKQAEAVGDAPPGAATRADQQRKVLKEQAIRTTQIAGPIPLAKLKQQIREISRRPR